MIRGDFYEDDEPIEDLERAFDKGTPVVSWSPLSQDDQAIIASAVRTVAEPGPEVVFEEDDEPTDRVTP